jgi:hypothetical protein
VFKREPAQLIPSQVKNGLSNEFWESKSLIAKVPVYKGFIKIPNTYEKTDMGTPLTVSTTAALFTNSAVAVVLKAKVTKNRT